MRNGREPRRLRAVEALDSHVMVEPQPRAPLPNTDERPNLVAVPAQGLSDGQMFFDAVDGEEEVLFRISADALIGEDDLVSQDNAEDGETAPETEAMASIVAMPDSEAAAPEAAAPEAAPEAEMVAEAVAPAPEEVAEADAAAPEVVAEVAPEAEVVPSTPEVVAEVAPEAAPEAEAALIAGLAAHPLPYESPQTTPVDDPLLQARLARIHLRTGSFSLARAELETLQGRKQLNTAGWLDLAEVRWRTGDLHGAGEAASAYLAADGEEVLGFVIAAEATAMANRLAEARQFAEQAMLRYLSDLDPVFAGIARKAMWSAVVAPPATVPVSKAPSGKRAIAPTDAVETVVVLAAVPAPDAVAAPATEAPPAPDAVAAPVVESVDGPEHAIAESLVEPTVETTVEPATEAALEQAPELVEATVEPFVEPPQPAIESAVESAAGPAAVEPPAVEPAAVQPTVEPTSEAAAELAPEPAVEAEAPEDPTAAQADGELASGRSYLDGNDALLAALHFGVALRLNQTRASAVIEAIGDRGDLPLQMVRGEAVRLLGIAAHAAAASRSAVVEPAPEPVVEPEPPTQPTAPEPPPIRWD
ncbi:MAG TPA: hypothetical protein VF344_06950 [Candidatus Limnocylindrales bacterium]